MLQKYSNNYNYIEVEYTLPQCAALFQSLREPGRCLLRAEEVGEEEEEEAVSF